MQKTDLQARRERQEVEGKLAMADYRRGETKALENMRRLRALRLQSAELAAAAPVAAPPKRKPRAKKSA